MKASIRLDLDHHVGEIDPRIFQWILGALGQGGVRGDLRSGESAERRQWISHRRGCRVAEARNALYPVSGRQLS